MNLINKISTLSMLLLSVIFFSSCSSSPDSLTVIPSDAIMVSSIDVFSIARKGKLYDLSEYSFYSSIKEEIQNEDPETATFFNKILDDPTYTGVSLTSDIFQFMVGEAEESDIYMCYSADIGSESKFTQFMTDLIKASPIDVEIASTSQYKYIMLQGTKIGWDKDKILVMAPASYGNTESMELKFETLFNLDKKDQITEVEEFNNFLDNKKDLSVWVSFSNIEQMIPSREMEDLASLQMLRGSFISLDLDFQEDVISLHANIDYSDEMQEKLDKNQWTDHDFNTAILKNFPKKHLALGSFSINTSAYYELFSDAEHIKELEDGFIHELDVELKDFIKNIKGSAVASLYDFKEIEYSYMSYGYGFNESNSTKMNAQIPISSLGHFSSEDLESLNRGEQVECKEYYGAAKAMKDEEIEVVIEEDEYEVEEMRRDADGIVNYAKAGYSINIKDILADGGTAESALESGLEVDLYTGGWDYGRNKKVTESQLMPTFGVSFDIKDKEMILKVLNKITHDEVQKNDNHYSIDLDGVQGHFAFKDDVAYFTNDVDALAKFTEGGFEDNLGESDYASNIEDLPSYGYVDLNLKAYPQEIVGGGMMFFGGIINAIDETIKNTEIKTIDSNAAEWLLNFNEEGQNSLFTILKKVDAMYANEMAL